MNQPNASVVLDTTVVSLLFNLTPGTPYPYYQERLEGMRGVISFHTLEEAWFGAYRRGWGDRRRGALAEHLALYTVVWPEVTLVAETARLRAAQERKGRPLSHPDAWIAATALSLGCPLAAHDRDFGGVDGLALIQAPVG